LLRWTPFRAAKTLQFEGSWFRLLELSMMEYFLAFDHGNIDERALSSSAFELNVLIDQYAKVKSDDNVAFWHADSFLRYGSGKKTVGFPRRIIRRLGPLVDPPLRPVEEPARPSLATGAGTAGISL
jgi:hypothetical protein